MVQFLDVTKTYPGEIPAVKQVNLSIREGEFVFLIGPSGSGKTTLLKMLIRDEKPSDGKIFFNDQDITHISRGKIYKLRRQVGVIFQDYKLIQDKTSYENVAFAMEAAGKSGKEIKESVPYVLDIVGLGHRMNSFPAQLSGGEQQRVAIARALANNPKILIADEPTGNLDPASAWDIVQILTKINNWGTTIIMTTHGTEIVNSLNKRVVQMENGVVVRDDNKGAYEFSKAYEAGMLGTPEAEEPKKKKTTIKVNLTDSIKKGNSTQPTEQSPKDSQEKIKKAGIFSRLFGFGKKKSPSVESIKSVLPVEEVSEIDKSFATEFDNSKFKVEEKKEKKQTVKPVKKKNKDDNLKSQTVSQAEEKSENKNKPQEEEMEHPPHLGLGIAQKIEDTKEKQDSSKLKKSDKSLKKQAKKILVQELDLPNSLKANLIIAGYNNLQEIIDDGPEELADNDIIDEEDIMALAQAIEKALS